MPSLSREAVQVTARVAGISSRAFQVLRVETSAGSKQLDHAVVLFDLGHKDVQQYIQDLDLAQLEVRTPDSGTVNLVGAEMNIIATIDGQEIVWHWGVVTLEEVDMGANEAIKLISRVEQYHFGRPLPFQKVFDPLSDTLVYSDHDVCFNPEIEGKIVGNKRPSGSPSLPYPVFVQPESMKTPNAALFQVVSYADPNDILTVAENSAENWNLQEAAYYLCEECNSGAVHTELGTTLYIENPLLSEIEAVLPSDRNILKNHTIRRGMYLPEALDALLEPYGFQTRLDYISPTSRKLRIIQSGIGDKRELLWQEAFEDLDLSKTNTDEVNLHYDVSMAVNQVRATGDFTYLEATWELMPAWDSSYDGTGIGLLSTGHPQWKDRTQYHRVWRDWVLNEAGDYQRAWRQGQPGGFAPGTANQIITQTFRDQFGPDHPEIVPKRRKFLPMLTRGDDNQPLGKVHGCHVQWWNPRLPGGNWAELDPNIEFFSCRLLEDECGISFTGSVPPIFIRNAGSNARVRITAVVRSDSRIFDVAERRAVSVNPGINERVLDVGSRFHWKQIHPGSVYYSDVTGGRRKADTADGRAGLTAFARAARDAWDQAQCSGTARLEGLEHTYKIGDIITKVSGREVRFGLTKSDAEEGRYPQIVGIMRDIQNQKITVTLAEFKANDAQVAGLLHKTRRLK